MSGKQPTEQTFLINIDIAKKERVFQVNKTVFLNCNVLFFIL